uniref:Uncharacterized protein n=1 Tax=Glossina palpalis gambiensis TaxID=67801 RepID=A0A1B0B145_9MUSC
MLNDVRCCNCNHKSRINGVHNQMLWFKKMTRFYQIGLGVLSFSIIFGTYVLWLTSYYNEARNYGGESSTTCFLWPFSSCPVAF